MPKTSVEVATLALRRLGVVGMGEPPQAEELRHAREVLAGLVAEIAAAQGMTVVADLEAVPDARFLPLAYLLACDLAPHYEIAPRDARSVLIGRLRAQLLPDDREDARDLDDDGTVSAAEEAVGAAFF